MSTDNFVPTEDFVVMTNLINVRAMRPWIDCEFSLYQKLCRNREQILDFQLEQNNFAMRKIRKEQRVPARNHHSQGT